MRGTLLVLIAALALSACGGGETTTVTESETRTETATATETVTQTETVAGPVGRAAARRRRDPRCPPRRGRKSGDYEALRPLIPASGFSYTFGLPAEGGPIAYWQQVEQESGESPIEVLARILRMPYTLSGGTYVWPFAYDKTQEELTAHERELLGDLADDYSGAGSGYLGWRAGIEPDGTWRFFIAGD